MKRLLVLLVAVLAFIGQPALADPTFPKLTGRVVDDAHLMSDAQVQSLDAKLAALETQTGHQLVVVTLPSLQGYEIEDYGYQLGRAWGIGGKANNDGVLLIVAPNERKVRVEVGYGLEGTITDALSSVIINTQILPRFKSNDYPGGIEAGVDALAQQLQLPPEQAQQRAAQVAEQAKADNEPQFDFGTVVFLVIFFLFFVLPFIRALRGGGRRYGRGPGVMIFPGGGWGGGGGSWGGGGFGGGGGFSGGGGSFGGGGASGSW